MKWIFAVMITASAGAQALQELNQATESDMERFRTINHAVDAQSFREKVQVCAGPEWADKEFITDCLHWAETAVKYTRSQPEKKPSEGSVGR